MDASQRYEEIAVVAYGVRGDVDNVDGAVSVQLRFIVDTDTV